MNVKSKLSKCYTFIDMYVQLSPGLLISLPRIALVDFRICVAQLNGNVTWCQDRRHAECTKNTLRASHALTSSSKHLDTSWNDTLNSELSPPAQAQASRAPGKESEAIRKQAEE